VQYSAIAPKGSDRLMIDSLMNHSKICTFSVGWLLRCYQAEETPTGDPLQIVMTRIGALRSRWA